MVWKDFLFFTGGKSFLIIKAFGYALLLVGFAWFHKLEHPNSGEWMSGELVRAAFGTLAVLLTVEMVLYASNSLFQEVRQSAVGSLKMLPIPTPLLLLQKTGSCAIALIPVVLAMAFLCCYDRRAILNINDIQGTIFGWIIAISLMTHLTVLLSLYVRWAALPIAACVTAVSFTCIGAAALGLTHITRATAELNGIPWGVWLGVFVNLMWLWLFVLLPIEIEIVNRWNRLSRE